MTTSEKTAPRDESPAIRTILGWLDDDDLVAQEDIAGAALLDAFALNETVRPFADDLTQNLISPCSAAGSTRFAETSMPMSHRVIRYNVVLSDIWAAADLPAHVFKTVGGVVSSDVGMPRVPAVGGFVALARPYDFHSSAMPDLADIELTLGSVNNAVREFVGRYVREHGAEYYDAAHESDSTGLAYTDRLGDYPPLNREYEDVEVVIGTEDEFEPRRYTYEDHQVWRI